MTSQDPTFTASELRRRAEKLNAPDLSEDRPLTDSEVRRALHELRVHQIELELQNEALQESEAEAREAVHSLAQLNQTIEARIVQRTAELAKARDAAEAANRAKSAFLSNISHELRTPMNGVMGMIELALMRSSDTKVVQWLGVALDSANHLLAIIDDLLDISSMEGERLPIGNEDIRLGSLVGSIAETLAPEVARRGLALEVQIPAALADRPLVGDARRLGQILMKLAVNAVKFTTEGSVRISVRLEAELAEGPMVRLEVRDSGIGIAPKDQERLFRPFTQVEQTISRRYGGTGVGLALCKHNVDLLGGRINLVSELGSGSTFWITVPLRSRE